MAALCGDFLLPGGAERRDNRASESKTRLMHCQHAAFPAGPERPSGNRGTGPAAPFPDDQTNASAVSAGAGPYFSGAMVKLARPWLTLRTAAE
jgi:hypothetical protein